MIDGKLSDGGKQTPNVQVVMGDTGPGTAFGFEDEEGQFLVVPAEATNPEEPLTCSNHEREEETPEHTEVEAMEAALDAAAGEIKSLQAEVSDLEQKLTDETSRFREMWRTNCEWYDSIIAEKDVDLGRAEA